MGAVARTVVASIVSCVGNGHAPQMGAHTKDNDPLGVLHPLLVVLGVTQLSQVDALLCGDLLLCAVAYEQGFPSPLEGHILALWNIGQLDLDFGQGQDISRGTHRGHELADNRFGSIDGHHSGRPGDQVGEHLSGLAAVLRGLVGVLDFGAPVV